MRFFGRIYTQIGMHKIARSQNLGALQTGDDIHVEETAIDDGNRHALSRESAGVERVCTNHAALSCAKVACRHGRQHGIQKRVLGSRLQQVKSAGTYHRSQDAVR